MLWTVVQFLYFGALSAAVASDLLAQGNRVSVQRYTPFTAEVTSTDIFEHGGAKVYAGKFFRKSDWSYARIEASEAYDDERGTVGYIIDAPTRSRVGADSFTNVARKVYRSESEFRRLVGSEGDCRDGLESVHSMRVAESQKLGLRVIEVERKVSENLTTRRWVAL